MSPELIVLALAGLLQALQFALMAAPLNRDLGPAWTLSPRDRPPSRDLSVTGGRLHRAFLNHFEALALFTIAVVVVTLGGQSSGVTATCAWLYLVARILYIPAYAFGWVPWRTLIWAVGFLATLGMILAALI